jgi:hypothetical protein
LDPAAMAPSELVRNHGTQPIIDCEPVLLRATAPQVSLVVGEPRLVTAVGFGVARDLPVPALVALADPSPDALHRLAGR